MIQAEDLRHLAARVVDRTPRGLSRGLVVTALSAGAALGGLMVWSGRRSVDVERANPPMGTFVEAQGIRLHVVARGQGRPVVLLHGLAGMVQDWSLSVLDRVARSYRTLAFDRPGYGWSERPRWARWTPERQAEAVSRAVARLGLAKPVVVGHEYGALAALAWALEEPAALSAIVLLSGHYYPSKGLDLPTLGMPELPGLGLVAQAAVSPFMGRKRLAKVGQKLFAPNPVPAIYSLYPGDMALRPAQLAAQAEDAAQLKEATKRLSKRYGEVRVPTVILAGDADRYADPMAQSVRLHRDIPHSALKLLPDAGHMLHHVQPGEVLSAVDLAWHEADVVERALKGMAEQPVNEPLAPGAEPDVGL
jgi:pimeloyl-ACP methyl ester carboxylesterase